MKTLQRFRLVLLALVVVLSARGAWAQSYTISNTTLNGAVTSSQNTFVLTSASASSGSSFGAPAAGQCYFVDGEFGRITGISSTTLSVTRPVQGNAGVGTGSGAAPHATAAKIFTAPCNAFKAVDPLLLSSGGNSCSTQPAPWINYKSANIWWCNTVNNVWTGTNYMKFTYNSVPTAQ